MSIFVMCFKASTKFSPSMESFIYRLLFSACCSWAFWKWIHQMKMHWCICEIISVQELIRKPQNISEDAERNNNVRFNEGLKSQECNE